MYGGGGDIWLAGEVRLVDQFDERHARSMTSMLPKPSRDPIRQGMIMGIRDRGHHVDAHPGYGVCLPSVPCLQES